MLEKYRPIIFPFESNICELSPKEAKYYHAWFLEQIPIRVNLLKQTISDTEHLPKATLDLSPRSLIELGDWYNHIIRKFRVMKKVPITKNIRFGLLTKAESYSPKLPNEVFSLAIDIGTYLGEVFIKNINGTRWDQIKKPKNHYAINQIVIMNDKNIECNPINLTIIFANKLATEKAVSSRLYELYDLWKIDLEK